MASSSFYSPPNWRYSVFTSFHGPDVRKTFLSHLRKQFICSGITMFDDQGIERSQNIAPAITQAIRESRIWIVILSKKYASSSWCLRELVEILECKEATGQIVMTIFYGADPSDVRQQTGDFGSSFVATCARTTEEERNHVGNIAGEHFLNWDNESEMIEKIARDVSNKLNGTTCKDFEDIVGIETKMLKDTDKASNEEEENNVEGKEHAYCWSWFVYCFDFSRIVCEENWKIGLGNKTIRSNDLDATIRFN